MNKKLYNVSELGYRSPHAYTAKLTSRTQHFFQRILSNRDSFPLPIFLSALASFEPF